MYRLISDQETILNDYVAVEECIIYRYNDRFSAYCIVDTRANLDWLKRAYKALSYMRYMSREEYQALSPR